MSDLFIIAMKSKPQNVTKYSTLNNRTWRTVKYAFKNCVKHVIENCIKHQ